jgi:hypothetical protein
VAIEREQLSKLAASIRESAEWEALLLTYAERWRDDEPPDWMLLTMPVQDVRRMKMNARRAVVEHVADLWIAARARGSGAYIKKTTHGMFVGYDGTLIRLLEQFFSAAGDPQTRATLYHDITFLRAGRERQHKKKPQP